jgi:flavin reductase (DIM6/NTAB) family NADH-FMN oxidoreductase RutF
MDTIRAKEDVLEKITYGFHVVTTRADRQELSTRDRDYIAAGTISWAMQSSFEPPMVTIAVAKDSDLNETIPKAGSFALNILGKDDKALVDDFAKDSVIRKDQTINGYDFLNGTATEAPILDRGIGYLECELAEQVKTDGDHVLFIGKVVNSDLRQPEHLPLHEWETGKQYGGFPA